MMQARLHRDEVLLLQGCFFFSTAIFRTSNGPSFDFIPHGRFKKAAWGPPGYQWHTFKEV